mmetsp:Transcript_60883/g.132078  ORF Transcript_60883/g.132078 Transcript_60883/m.132078 type:complete len:123 (+) Transcript_60883:2-370(+)
MPQYGMPMYGAGAYAWPYGMQQAAFAQYAAAAGMAQAQPALATGAPAACAVAGTGEPSTAWITNRLIDREKARIDRNYDEADKIRADLRKHGVEVEDRERTWTHRDGRRGHRPNHNDPPEQE